MSSSSRMVAGFCVGVLLLFLAGCGFRPTYGTHSAYPGVSEDMATVRVLPIDNRDGQILHTALVTKLSPRGEPVKPVFVLTVALSVSETDAALQKDNSATRAFVTYRAHYTLTQGDETVDSGVVSRTMSYDYLLEHYANLVASEDIRRRATQNIADAIRSELAAYFTRRHQALDAGTGRHP